VGIEERERLERVRRCGLGRCEREKQDTELMSAGIKQAAPEIVTSRN